jgi:MoaA/NifB/PqqE/SkfB family radical SAM enzyme
MQTEVLGFIFTETCNFRCRHCCNESGPDAHATMGATEIEDHIAEAARSGRFREIGISGGEPFLFPGELLVMVQAARRNGLGSSVTTNAYWARTEQRARATIEPLVRAGLTSIAISVSSFHLEFNSVDRLLTAARAALQAGLVTRVNVVVTADFTLLDARSALAGIADRVTFVPMPCIPVGRAAAQVSPQQLPRRWSPPSGNCQPFFTKIAVTPAGEVFPCCSPGGFTPPLLLGNIRDTAISEIIDRMEEGILFQVLEVLGPAFFVPFLEEELSASDLLADVVDQCHLCHTIFSDDAMTAVAHKALNRLEDDLRRLDLSFHELIEAA